MKIIVAGAGTIGYQVAKTLSADGQDVVIIDPEAEVIKDALNRFDCMAITGVANSLEDLEAAGVAKADYFIALTPSDELNILSCAMVSAEYGRVRTIARVRSGNYANAKMYKSLGSGIHHFINPEVETVANVLRALAYGAVSSINAFPGMDIQVRSFSVGRGSKLHGQTLVELAGFAKLRFLILLIQRSEFYLVPSGKTIIREGDVLFVAASEKDFGELFARFGTHAQSLNTVLILGGTRMGEIMAAFLSGSPETPLIPGIDQAIQQRLFGKRNVRIIEQDKHRCEELAERYQNIQVIRGDIADETLFDEEQLSDCDVVLALGGSEERNIVAGLYAKRRGIKRAICLVQSGNYLAISRHLDVDVAVSLRNAVATSVLGIIREDSVESVQTLGDGTMEILEFIVDPGCGILGKEVMKIIFPQETLVLALKRGQQSFIASGATIMEVGDRVLVMARKDKTAQVQKLFASNGDA